MFLIQRISNFVDKGFFGCAGMFKVLKWRQGQKGIVSKKDQIRIYLDRNFQGKYPMYKQDINNYLRVAEMSE